MFKLWKILDQKNIVIKTLWIIIALLLLINVVIGLSLATVPSRLRIYLPPDLSHGSMVTPSHVPRATVYAFAFQIFTAINSWSESGTKNYQKNISAYRNYLSGSFYQQLQEDLKEREENGELSRARIMSGVSGMGYQSSDVTVIGNGSWLVNMHLQIQETLDGQVIKNVIMDYPLLVSQVHASISVNPWGLEISGFDKPAYRLKTII